MHRIFTLCLKVWQRIIIPNPCVTLNKMADAWISGWSCCKGKVSWWRPSFRFFGVSFEVWKEVSSPGAGDRSLLLSSSSVCLCCSPVWLFPLLHPVGSCVGQDWSLAWFCCVTVHKLLHSYFAHLEETPEHSSRHKTAELCQKPEKGLKAPLFEMD